MRRTFAHDAVLIMEPDADIQAPGAAVTVALCGHWEHEPPCPLAPHHTQADRIDGEVQVRILFAADSHLEGTVRRRIESALSSGQLRGPDSTTTRWRLRDSRRGTVSAAETDHTKHLISTSE
jgi:hypothetical protein